MDLSFLRKNMVDCQLKPNKIINLNLIDAFLNVPREIFVNKKNINRCYLDVNIDLSKNRFLLNPMVSARLIQSLNISKDDTVLTIYPLAPDVPPTSIDPWSTDLADARVTKVNICTSKMFILYLSSGLPKVLSGSSIPLGNNPIG